MLLLFHLAFIACKKGFFLILKAGEACKSFQLQRYDFFSAKNGTEGKKFQNYVFLHFKDIISSENSKGDVSTPLRFARHDDLKGEDEE